MKNIFYPTIICMFCICLITAGIVVGCKGSDTKEKVDDVVEEVTGKNNVERMQKMKQDIDEIKEVQKNRLNQIDQENE